MVGPLLLTHALSVHTSKARRGRTNGRLDNGKDPEHWLQAGFRAVGLLCIGFCGTSAGDQISALKLYL